jgi:hypothetical protein
MERLQRIRIWTIQIPLIAIEAFLAFWKPKRFLTNRSTWTAIPPCSMATCDQLHYVMLIRDGREE